MNTSIQYLDAIKAKTGAASDYAVAKILDVKPNRISNYRTGVSKMDDEMALKVARLLEIEPFIVLAALHAERATSEQEKAAWKAAFEKLGGTAALIALGIMLNVFTPSPANASAGSSDLQSRSERDLSIHYAKLDNHYEAANDSDYCSFMPAIVR